MSFFGPPEMGTSLLSLLTTTKFHRFSLLHGRLDLCLLTTKTELTVPLYNKGEIRRRIFDNNVCVCVSDPTCSGFRSSKLIKNYICLSIDWVNLHLQ